MPKRKHALPNDFAITPKMREWFKKQGFTINIDSATERWKDACRSKNYQYVDHQAAWRNAMRFAQSWHDERHGPKPKAQVKAEKKTLPPRDRTKGMKKVSELLDSLKHSNTESQNTTKEPLSPKNHDEKSKE